MDPGPFGERAPGRTRHKEIRGGRALVRSGAAVGRPLVGRRASPGAATGWGIPPGPQQARGGEILVQGGPWCSTLLPASLTKKRPPYLAIVQPISAARAVDARICVAASPCTVLCIYSTSRCAFVLFMHIYSVLSIVLSAGKAPH